MDNLYLCENMKKDYNFFKNNFLIFIYSQDWILNFLKNINLTPEQLYKNFEMNNFSKNFQKQKMTSVQQVFYGEILCQNIKKSCKNKAYYEKDGKYLCGVHCKNQDRKQLPKNPNAKQRKEESNKERFEIVQKVASVNLENKREGNVYCSKLRMMKEPEQIDGYLKVFPNFKHQNRADGFGCASLSPKSLGPIDSGQPGLPIALTLENFHQGNKVFRSETDRSLPGKEYKVYIPSKKTFENLYIADKFFETQRKMYEDSVPYRHKIDIDHKTDKPVGSLWVRKDGTMVFMTYFESRQFYCVYYQRMVPSLQDFQSLAYWKSIGYNLQIVGYDSYDPFYNVPGRMESLMNNTAKSYTESVMRQCYKDTSKPFGHELVLCCLLLGYAPWEEFITEEF